MTAFARLDRPGDQLRLDATIDWSKARLLILDPLVRLHDWACSIPIEEIEEVPVPTPKGPPKVG